VAKLTPIEAFELLNRDGFALGEFVNDLLKKTKGPFDGAIDDFALAAWVEDEVFEAHEVDLTLRIAHKDSIKRLRRAVRQHRLQFCVLVEMGNEVLQLPVGANVDAWRASLCGMDGGFIAIWIAPDPLADRLRADVSC